MNNVASVKDRLKNKAIVSGKTMQEVLVSYGLEGVLYRLSVSRHADSFTLKGGILLYALFDGNYPRATTDIDLLAQKVSNNEDDIYKMFAEILSAETDDLLRFDCGDIAVKRITENDRYHGVNVSTIAWLDRTRIPISVDIGFGDAVYPQCSRENFPSVLNDKEIRIKMYSPETVIAEKFEAIVSLGYDNSRLKDFYDLYVLSREYDFDGQTLADSIKKTCDCRGTSLNEIVAFEDSFKDDSLRKSRWAAFVRKKKALRIISLDETIEALKMFLLPVISSLYEDGMFRKRWDSKEQKWK